MKLLAKSVNSNNAKDWEALTLVGHLELGILSALEFKDIAPIICQQLDLDITPEELTLTVAIAIWIHDWGKVSEDFQAFVQSKSKKTLLRENFGITDPLIAKEKQAIRHELLSVILAYQKSVWDWLIKVIPNKTAKTALLGVLAHHLRIRGQDYFDKPLSSPLKTYAHTSEFKEVLKLGVKHFQLDGKKLPQLSAARQFNQETIACQKKQIKEWCFKVQTLCDNDLQNLKKIAVVKALVMSADLAASALLEEERGDRTYTQWIREALLQTLTESEIQQVIAERLEGKPLLPFQAKEAEKKSRVLIVIAGCGAGKTLVPFVRFQRLIKQGNLQPKMFFCYPTTVTTSEGFKDYGLKPLGEKALVSHSRVWADYQLKIDKFLQQLQGVSESYENESDTDKDRDSESKDTVQLFQTKVEALKLWHSKLIFCTAHTVLGLIQNHRKGLYGFPAIAQGAFVFDEIHAYPPELFGALLQFIRLFRHAQIVLMSASLTPAQEQAIQEVLKETNESADILAGPKEIEELQRYQLVEIENQDLAWDEAIAELKTGGKVLWITNKVADSQHLYTEALERFKTAGLAIEPILYHARFRYKDSLDRQEKLTNAFKGNEPAFAVTTQIAEMSLDISCTLLISANAPMWALVQRLGRLNRWVDETSNGYKLRTGRVCKALIYPWERDGEPYEIKDLETAKKLLESLKGKQVSQVDLTGAIATLSTQPPKPASSTWLETWLTRQKELMPPAYTIQVLLETDIEKIFAAATSAAKKPLLEAQKWAVSVPLVSIDTKRKPHPAFKFYRTALTSEIRYHPAIGAYNPKDELLSNYYGHQT